MTEGLDEARREGERMGAARYLGDAVAARLASVTGRSHGDMLTMMGHLEAESFVDDNGDIDQERIERFAATLSQGAPAGAAVDPVAAALARRPKSKREETRDRILSGAGTPKRGRP